MRAQIHTHAHTHERAYIEKCKTNGTHEHAKYIDILSLAIAKNLPVATVAKLKIISVRSAEIASRY